jgi:hypothetical protein
LQSIDPKTPQAKLEVMHLFEDKIGREKSKPYYVSQIKVIFEDKFSDDVIYQAVEQLIEEKKLSKIVINTKFAGKVIFIYNSEFDKPYSKPLLKTHINSSCKLIDKYSKPIVAKRYADHLEDLVEKDLETEGFKIVDTHTNEYKKKKLIKVTTILISLLSTVQAN